MVLRMRPLFIHNHWQWSSAARVMMRGSARTSTPPHVISALLLSVAAGSIRCFRLMKREKPRRRTFIWASSGRCGFVYVSGSRALKARDANRDFKQSVKKRFKTFFRPTIIPRVIGHILALIFVGYIKHTLCQDWNISFIVSHTVMYTLF